MCPSVRDEEEAALHYFIMHPLPPYVDFLKLLGAFIKDVRVGGGSWKRGWSKGGCVNFIV